MGQWLQLVGARRGEATGGQSAPPRRFERESESHHAWRDRRPVQISAQRRLIKGAPEPGAARLQMHSLRVIVLIVCGKRGSRWRSVRQAAIARTGARASRAFFSRGPRE